MGLSSFQSIESLLIHESLKIPFGAFVAAFHFSSNPKCRKGSHQTPDSESGPWESHPRRVLRRFRRKVSLYPKPVMAVSVAIGYFRMVSGALSTLCPADTVSGRWVLAYLHSAVDLGNVSDEWYSIFKVPGRLIAFSLSLSRIFSRDSQTFSNKFCAGSRKQKSAHCTCLAGAVSAKIRPGDFSPSLVSEYVVLTEKQPRRITSAGLKCNRIFLSASVVHPWCKLVYGLVYERLF